MRGFITESEENLPSLVEYFIKGIENGRNWLSFSMPYKTGGYSELVHGMPPIWPVKA